MTETSLNTDGEMEFVSTKLYVKYMVSLRCKMIVKSEMEDLGLAFKFSPHGAIEFGEGISKSQFGLLKKNLIKSGLVLLNENESILIDKIINTIIEVIHYTDTLPKVNFADIINKYAIMGDESILKIFSDVKGMSILQFIVVQKIERAKELILYDDKSDSEIAEMLNYKNKRYLLAQFKKLTGLTPSDFKRMKKERTRISQHYSNSHKVNVSGMKSQGQSQSPNQPGS